MQVQQAGNLLLPDERDKCLMAFLDDIPLVPTPWASLADQAGCSEGELLEKLRSWSSAGIFKQFRGLWNNSHLGYASSLLAVEANSDRVDELGNAIAQCPFVSHDFLRSGGRFNLWFTLTCPKKGPTLAQTLQSLQEVLKIDIRRFDTVRHFKISFKGLFQLTSGTNKVPEMAPQKQLPDAVLLQTIGILQNDLPLTPRPFAELGEQSGLSEDDLVESLRILKNRRILRRIGAIWNFKAIQMQQNVMCAWDIPEEQAEAFGRHAGNHPRVSHCYQRTHFPDWPWKIYTVIHGRDRAECLNLIQELAGGFPDARPLPLWTEKEYKQSPIRYDPEKITLQ